MIEIHASIVGSPSSGSGSQHGGALGRARLMIYGRMKKLIGGLDCPNDNQKSITLSDSVSIAVKVWKHQPIA